MNRPESCYCCISIALLILVVGSESSVASRSSRASGGASLSEDYFGDAGAGSPLDADLPLDPDVFVAPQRAAGAIKVKVLGPKGVRANTISYADSRDRRGASADFDDSELGLDSLVPSDDNSITREKVISLLRNSNLLVPFESGADYETLLRSPSDMSARLAAPSAEAPDNNDNIDDNQVASILRSVQGAGKSSAPDIKFIHAPTHHHYYPSAGSIPPSAELAAAAAAGAEQVTASRRLLPGDPVYGSYDFGPIGRKQSTKATSNRMEAAAASAVSSRPYGIMLDETNDIYFLVMVGAFCVMAMAVVLAAGMFAYRVQQNRKTSADTDYPTYGVVGPSIMNSKCGAAAFVGGYLGGGHGPGGSAAASKSGSKSHLADSVSGDSGLAASDRSSCKRSKNGGSMTSLDQQQAAGGQQAALQQQQKSSNSSAYLNNQNAARMYHYQHQKQQMIVSDRASNGRHTSASDLDSEDENDDGSYTVYECPGLASAHEMEIKNPMFDDDRTP